MKSHFPLSFAFTFLATFLATLSSTTNAAITEEDAEAYKNWPSWGFHERLNFLLYEEDWANFRSEFFIKDLERSNNIILEGTRGRSEATRHYEHKHF